MEEGHLLKMKPHEEVNIATLDDISILYKSGEFLVVNKHYDVRINSDNPEHHVTVEHQLRQRFPELVDDSVQHGFRFQHRLDHATSGVLCLCLNKIAAAKFQQCMQQRLVTKHYLALVRGFMKVPEPNTPLKVDIGIGQESSVQDRCFMCCEDNSNCQNPRSASTSVILLEHGTYDDQPASKLLLVPHTGRTHQLRVHCMHLGHTIVGDFTYSNRQDTKPNRMMLHAFRLVVPMSKEPLDVITEDPFITEIDPLWCPTKIWNNYEDFKSAS